MFLLSSRPRSAWLILSSLLLLLLGAVLYMAQAQLQKDIDQARNAAERELGLLASLVKNDLLHGNYQHASSTLMEWGEARPDIVSLRLQADNGFLISAYQRNHASQDSLSLATDIQYSYAGEAQLSLVRDLAPLRRDSDLLLLQLGVAYLVLAGLWIALTRSVLLYRNESITLRARTQALDQANADLRQAMVKRQQAEGERDRLVSILEATPDLVSMADPTGHVLYLNRAGRQLTGLGNRALGSLQIPNLHPAWAAELIQHQGLPTAMREGHWSGETALLGPDGEEIPVSHVILSHRDAAGEVQYLSTIMRDDRRRKKTEAALHDTMMMQRAILDHAGFAIISTTPDGLIASFNPAAERMLGYAATEVVGQTTPDFFHLPTEVAQRAADLSAELGRPIEAGFEAFAAKSRLGQINEREWTYVRKDGSHFPVWLSVTALRNAQGEISGFLGMAVDISVRKQTDAELKRYRQHLEQMVEARTAELRAVNQELESFAYSVSHDLRGPLRAIDGFSQALLEDYGDRLDDTGRDHLNRVRGGVQRMSALIDDLLKLSRLNRKTMQPKPVDLSALAHDILKRFAESEPGRAVTSQITPGLVAIGDPGLLRAALENLLGNAWKYTSTQPVAHIEFSRNEQHGESVYVVRDNGVGFDMAHADKLFDPFQRLHHRDEFEGTGIGLATVQRIVHRHGGRIWAEAAPGQGATFYFTLSSPALAGQCAQIPRPD